MKISLIGCGNMGGAIARALCRAAAPECVSIANRSAEKAQRLAAELGCAVAETNIACAADADFVFLGVKPAGIFPLLEEISPALREDAVIVSMAAGVTGTAMRDALGGKQNPLVRILPNTPCAIGKGLVLIAPCGTVAEASLEKLAALLAPCGRCARTDEAHADAGMTAGGCTPAYTYLFIDALAAGGERAGLSREEALQWAAAAVAGAAELLLQSGKTPGQLCDEVCSPGGSTIEGVNALRDGGFSDLVAGAFEKSYVKNGLLGK